MCSGVCVVRVETNAALPVAPAAVGQSDKGNLRNEQKSIPLKPPVVGGLIDVARIVDGAPA